MEIKLTTEHDALALSNYYNTNAKHLQEWEILKEPGFHQAKSWRKRLKQRELEQQQNKAAYFVAYNNSATEIIATCNLTGIIYGGFLACFMGYSVALSYQGQGKMKQLCHFVIQYAFDELELNRIMSNYMPRNIRSQKLLYSLGFVQEGKAKSYLYINGKWEDHILTSLINVRNL